MPLEQSRRLSRQQRRDVRRATLRACRESNSPAEAIAKAEQICRDEYGFVEALIIALIVAAISKLVPIIWNWLNSDAGPSSDADILAELEGVNLE